jgi:hypothetical protein
MWFSKSSQIPSSLSERAQSLHDEIAKAAAHYQCMARLNYHFSLALVWLALGASVFIAVGGIAFNVSAKMLGITALVPTIAMLVNTVYQPQSRSRWHYAKRDRLNAMRRRLKYELPERPTADNIAAVSHDWAKLDVEMDDHWHKTIQIDWNAISSLKVPSSSTPPQSN